MITMKEIAKESGTSQATVSRVLNGNMSVSPEVRNRVMECIKRYNYQPNMLAQSLAANKTLLIGVLIPDIANPFFADLVHSIESHAMKYGYSIILCNTNGSLAKEKYYLNILRSYKVDGVIMVPRNMKDKSFLSLKGSSTPIVISTVSVSGFDCVAVSHFDAGRNVAKHFIENGFRKFAYVGYPDDDKERGFITGIESAGFHIADDYVFVDLSIKNARQNKLLPLIQEYRNERSLGLFALNDVIALIVLDDLKENNIKIPEEAGLIGFDNTFIGKEVSPSISSVAQPIEEIGQQSVEMLIERIGDKEAKTTRNIQLDFQIIARASSIR